MSLEHSPERDGRLARDVDPRGPPLNPLCFTVDEFCKAHRVSRSMLYLLWQEGKGPRFMNVGVKKLISHEAAADWRRDREAAAST